MKLPFLPLYIDQFSNPERLSNATYLLSHFHTDHMPGLSPSWCGGTIICDEVTGALVLQKYGTALAKYLKPWPLFQSLLLFQSTVPAFGADTTDDGVRRTYAVASGGSSEMGAASLCLLPAFHVPGSVMFFLETSFGNILYTGDFKYDEHARDHLNPFFATHRVDYLYIDDMWLHVGVGEACLSETGSPCMRVSCKMLSRSELAEAIEALGRRMDKRVRDFAQQGDQQSGGAYVLRVYLHNNFGKEHLVQRLASRLGVTAFVDKGRYERIRLVASFNAAIAEVDEELCMELERFAPYASGHGSSTYPRIEVVSSLQHISHEELQASATRCGGTPHYGIVISGWARMRRRDGLDGASVWVIPTTLHCTPQQLIDFVALLRPMSVTPLHYKPCRGTVVLERLGPYLRRPYVNQFLSVSESVLMEAGQWMDRKFPQTAGGGDAEMLHDPCETTCRGFCIAPPKDACRGVSDAMDDGAFFTQVLPPERASDRKRPRDVCSPSPVRIATPAQKTSKLTTLSLSQMTDLLGL